MNKQNGCLYTILFGSLMLAIQLFSSCVDTPETEIPTDDTLESTELKAVFKNQVYITQVCEDSKGNRTYSNPEFLDLMNVVDGMPDIEMLILADNTIYYYDQEDIKGNRPFDDVKSFKSSYNTRSSGFEDFDPSCLGFMALYDKDNFGGSHLSKGLSNFHFTWNLPDLKNYGMNDKITSIALAYNHTDPLICAVLTIWDDTDYNHGDKNRSKHRISVVSSKNSPRVCLNNLNAIKKIGSSKSWNDCISSISFHFGYTDRLLFDY